MAAPLTADAFVRALRAEGVRITEHAGWRDHNRNHKGAWGPVHGVMLHHTAGSSSVGFCRRGAPELPGPLCAGVVTKDGAVHLIGYGRTNHAGSGSSAVLAAVREELPLPAPGPDAVDGNARFYGFEIENLGSGRDPYPAAQLDAVERLSAALCRVHRWSAASVIGHKEWTRRKIDPSFSMAGMRNRIAGRLGGHPVTDPPPCRCTRRSPAGPSSSPATGTRSSPPWASDSWQKAAAGTPSVRARSGALPTATPTRPGSASSATAARTRTARRGGTAGSGSASPDRDRARAWTDTRRRPGGDPGVDEGTESARNSARDGDGHDDRNANRSSE